MVGIERFRRFCWPMGIGMLLVLTGCPRDEFEEPHTAIEYRISLRTDSISVGDTLWLESHFDKNFQILEKNSYETYSGKIRLSISLDKVIEGANSQTGSDIYFAKEDFDVLMVHGQYDSRSLMLQFMPTFADHYHLKVAIIPKYQGLYMLNDGMGSFLDEPYLKILGGFDVADANSHLLNPSFYWANYTVSNSKFKGIDKRTFFFYVK